MQWALTLTPRHAIMEDMHFQHVDRYGRVEGDGVVGLWYREGALFLPFSFSVRICHGNNPSSSCPSSQDNMYQGHRQGETTLLAVDGRTCYSSPPPHPMPRQRRGHARPIVTTTIMAGWQWEREGGLPLASRGWLDGNGTDEERMFCSRLASLTSALRVPRRRPRFRERGGGLPAWRRMRQQAPSKRNSPSTTVYATYGVCETRATCSTSDHDDLDQNPDLEFAHSGAGASGGHER
jgi:hypothetical protein